MAADEGHPDHGKVKIFSTRDFGYHRITVERPLKLRFEITEDTLAALEISKPLARWDDRDAFADSVRGLLGTVWWTKKEAIRRPARGRQVRGRAVAVQGCRAQGHLVAPSRSPTPKARSRPTRTAHPLPDPDLRDYENVPLDEDIDAYFAREVTPHVPDAWIDLSKTKVGYEIPFTRHFYVYTPPRPLAEIDAELRDLESQIQKLLGEVTE